MAGRDIAALATGPWQQLASSELPAVPAMTSKAERQYYYWLTRERFTGAGAVVELGCWLGGGTVHLAAGLRDRGSTARVTCIDHFKWAGDAHERAFASGLAVGDDFEPLFRANIAFIAERIDVVRGDLADFTWTGGPIEILVVDAPKQREIVKAFLAAFGPHLIAGKSLVVFQDYLHGPSFALPAMLSEFDELRLVDVVLPGSTVGMELTRPLVLDAERLATSDPSRWSAAETAERWSRVIEPLPPEARDKLAVSLPMLLMSQGHVEAAQAETRRVAGKASFQRSLAKWRSTYLAVMYRPIFEAAGIEVKPTTAEMYFWMSHEAWKAGRLDAARAAAVAALQLDPSYKPAQQRVAMIDRRQAAEARIRAQAQAARPKAEQEQSRGAMATPPQAKSTPRPRQVGNSMRRAIKRARRAMKRLGRALFGSRPG